ncbi:hypothetical protein BDV96DRAFT_506409 [Lophiotrema nucula]|uniref:Uncharacterized protein n=1 Tax=Lophiotrema nucula TaxID=690887 RepID=A0A6A5YJU9_9PLEO|nr:hypothetical protein BDV96DRAFT_506409 [Lophiotrema nucula]
MPVQACDYLDFDKSAVAKRDSMDASVEVIDAKMNNTKLDQTSSSKKPLGLADLPPSVRNNIYKYVLDTEQVNVGNPNVSYTHTIKDGVLQFKASRSPFPVNTALFYVNKELSAEAVKYFYSKNLFVRFEVCTTDARHAKTMLEESGLLFSVAAADRVERSTQHAMDLTIVEKNSSHKRASVMFPAQYLPRLINFFEQASATTSTWAQTHSLFIGVRNTYDFPLARLQGDLLELFRLLTNLGAVTIEPKNLLPGFAEGLQVSMLAPTFTAEGWLRAFTEMTDRAAEDTEAGKHEIAQQHLQSAIISMTYGYLTRAEFLHSQKEEFTKSVQRLRWGCELGLANALAKQHQVATADQEWLFSSEIAIKKKTALARDLMLAEMSASRALSLATDSPSPESNPWVATLPRETIPPNRVSWFTAAERVESWLGLGRTHMALGEYIFACGDFERATRLMDEGDVKGPIRDEVVKVFEKARNGINWQTKPGVGLKQASKLARA